MSPNIKLFNADEPFQALPPKPRYVRSDPNSKQAWEEGYVYINPNTPQQYKVFIRWKVTIPNYKPFVERVSAQAAREHGHAFVVIRSTLHSATRSRTRPRTFLAGGKLTPIYQKDDPHITCDFGPSPLSTSEKDTGQNPLLTESAQVYCGHPPPSHGGLADGTEDYGNMTIWRDGCLGKWGSNPTERITWWSVAASSRGLDWGRSGVLN